MIELGEESGATVCFNNGSGSWDSQDGANYTVGSGIYGVKDGTVKALNEGGDVTNVATIYYNTAWSNPYIHYCVSGQSWTTVPGVSMTASTEQSGYTHKIEIVLGEEESVTVCFNDGSGSWDSNNGANYAIKAGTYGVKDGTIYKLK